MIDPKEVGVLDPDSIYTIHENGDLLPTSPQDESRSEGESAGPVLLHAIRGFVDAGSVGELFSDHLLESFSPRRLVDFDVDRLLAYRSRRPLMTFDGDRWADYDEPVLAVDELRDDEGTRFLLLHGLEPDLQWERFAEAVGEVVKRFDVSLVVGVHGIPMGVPHTRPATSTAHATRSDLLAPEPAVFGRVQVPSSASALLEYRLGEAGRDALGFAVHVPHYLAQGEYAPAAQEAIDQVEKVTGLALDRAALDLPAREAREEIDRQMAGSTEVREVVAALEEQYDKFMSVRTNAAMLIDGGPLPTAEELGAQFEQFLAEQDGDGEDLGGPEQPGAGTGPRGGPDTDAGA